MATSKDQAKTDIPERVILPEGPPVDPLIGLWSMHRQAAQIALATSDRTIVRCMEFDVTVPTAWIEYRKALRVIAATLSGDPKKTPLPTMPSYPKGT